MDARRFAFDGEDNLKKGIDVLFSGWLAPIAQMDRAAVS
jgi:hypothetical protein